MNALERHQSTNRLKEDIWYA